MVVFIIILLIIAIMAVPAIFLFMQKSSREQKNYERALKMVSLLINLPPASEDIQGGGRDVRDVVDESISKAQIIYNIIASTYQKGFKNRVTGQRHFGFEIVGLHGQVFFYATVPVVLIDVVKQSIISAYPAAQLEEIAEHNIFNKVGKLSAVTGGEFELKQDYAYPIATYQDLKRDSMQAILNALSTLENEDGVSIQILIRPADPSWRKTASSIASNKRKGKSSTTSFGGNSVIEHFMGYGKDIVVAFFKPPEPDKEKEAGSKTELSSMEQTVLDSIDDKTRSPGYEVLIRVIASSNITQRSQAITNNIVAAFALFDAPGKNGFKFVPSKETDILVSDYVLRFFPQGANKVILNSVELATIFHFPDQSNIPTSQLSRQESKQVDGPRNVPETGLLLGYNQFRGVKKPIRLSFRDRQRHLYTVGQTGTGKSTFLEGLAFQDMLNGDGFAYVDPHGDSIEKLLELIPKERTEDIVYFSPSDTDYPMGLNLFEFTQEDQKDFLIQEVISMLYKLYDPQHQGIMGPRYEDMFRNAALAVMADPNGGTLIEIPLLFRDPQFLKQKLQYVTDQTVLGFWQKQFPAMQRSNEAGEVTAWFVSKFGAFLSNSMMRNIIGQTKSAFDLRDIMDNKKILLVNLSKGRTGELNSKLLGMIFVMKFQAAAMSRASIPEDQRVDFCLYVDEFQNFSTDSFATIMSEARKFHLNLIVANQFTTQLSDEIRDAVFGNIGTTVAFRVGDQDADSLHKYFRPTFEETDILRLPNYNTIVRTMIDGVPTQPFSMATLPPLGNPNPKLPAAIKQLSAAKYGKPKSVVEADIYKRMESRAEEPKPAFQQNRSPFAGNTPNNVPGSSWPSPQQQAPGTGAPGTINTPPKPPAAPGSFLDEWISKRKNKPAVSHRTMASQAPADPAEPVQPAEVSQAPYIQPPSSASEIINTPPTGSTALPKPSDNQTANITSETINNKEINEIAQQLKTELQGNQPNVQAQQMSPLPPNPSVAQTTKSPGPSVTEPTANISQPILASEPATPPAPQPQPKAPPEDIKKKMFEFPIRDASEASKHEDVDTIFIDQDGNLRMKNDDQDQ